MQFRSHVILAVLAAIPASFAHMEMTNPVPLQHKSNKFSTNIDYSYTSPLSGPAQFPCKGFHKAGGAALTPVAEWEAGSQQTFTISGGASHNGGSCQASISEDGGATWKVIRSYIGGCPLKGTYSMTIPKETKSGDVLFSWSWFNLSGNREMYQNCASVKIKNGGAGLSSNPIYPDIFVANTGNTQCTFAEGSNPVFPNPGPDPEMGGGPTVQATGGGCVGVAPGGAPGGGAPSGGDDAPAKPEPVTPEPTSSAPAAQPTASSAPDAGNGNPDAGNGANPDAGNGTNPDAGNGNPGAGNGNPDAGNGANPGSGNETVPRPNPVQDAPSGGPQLGNIYYDPKKNPGIPSNNLRKRHYHRMVRAHKFRA